MARFWSGPTAALLGLLTGGLMGLAAWPASSGQPRRPGAGLTALMASCLVGLYLGWQAAGPLLLAVLTIFLGASVLACLPKWTGRGGWCMYLAVGLFVYIMFWRELADRIPMLAIEASVGQVLGSAVLVLLVALTTRWFTPAREFVRTEKGEVGGMKPIDREKNLQRILESQSYLPVEYDAEFLRQGETRPVRVQLELLKPEIALLQQGVSSTVVVFGGTQVVEREEAERKLNRACEALRQSPDDPLCQRAVRRLERIVAKSRYYDAARAFRETRFLQLPD